MVKIFPPWTLRADTAPDSERLTLTLTVTKAKALDSRRAGGQRGWMVRCHTTAAPQRTMFSSAIFCRRTAACAATVCSQKSLTTRSQLYPVMLWTASMSLCRASGWAVSAA